MALAVWPGKCRPVELEVAQEHLPALGHPLVHGVPLVAGAEARVDQADDAAAAVAGLDQPLEGQAVDPLASVEAPIRFGGSQAATRPGTSISGPGPNRAVAGPPWRSSTLWGTYHEEMPGPVAMAAQTSSGVPATSISTVRLRVPSAASLLVTLASVGWSVLTG